VSGADSSDSKEEKLTAFTAGEIRVLVTKPKIGAWGLNWQHCNRMTYFPSHSYEQWYQAIRRCWRFGQKQDVIVDVIATEGGRNVLANLQRKASQADAMFDQLVAHMNQAQSIESVTYDKRIEMPQWLES
jgi:SNF2 family DNA or RNA helicase